MSRQRAQRSMIYRITKKPMVRGAILLPHANYAALDR